MSKVLISTIQETVCRQFGMKMYEMLGQDRRRMLARPRQMAIYLALQHSRQPVSAVARSFGNRDRATVRHAGAVIRNLRNEDKSIAEALSKIEARLGVADQVAAS